MARLFALITLVLFSGACERSAWNDPGPDEAFESILVVHSQGDAQAVFDAIWEADREKIVGPLESLEKLDPSVRPEPWEMLVIAGMDHPYDINRTRLQEKLDGEPERGERVVVELIYMDDREGEVEMVWGGDRWYLSLESKVSDSENLDEATGHD